MKASICLLVASVTLLDPAGAHLWPLNQVLHSAPSDTIEPPAFHLNGVPGTGPEPPLPAFPPNHRFWKSDGVFLFRPSMISSAWNGGSLDQQTRLHNPLLERLLLSSPHRRSRFSRLYKDWSMEGSSRRSRRRVKGIKGHIDVNWSVQPIWEGSEDDDNRQPAAPLQPELLRRFNRESAFAPRWRSFPTLNPTEAAQPSEQQVLNEDDTANDAISTRRLRRQIGSWNPQRLFNRLLSNATGIFEGLGRQMSRQLHTSADGTRSMFNSMQQNFKRFVNLNISQLRPERLLAQIASLTRAH